MEKLPEYSFRSQRETKWRITVKLFSKRNSHKTIIKIFQTWNEILSSPSLSTMLNIFCTKRSPSFIPRAWANSLLDRVVRITMMTSEVASSSLRFSPGLRPKVRAYASLFGENEGENYIGYLWGKSRVGTILCGKSQRNSKSFGQLWAILSFWGLQTEMSFFRERERKQKLVLRKISNRQRSPHAGSVYETNTTYSGRPTKKRGLNKYINCTETPGKSFLVGQNQYCFLVSCRMLHVFFSFRGKWVWIFFKICLLLFHTLIGTWPAAVFSACKMLMFYHRPRKSQTWSGHAVVTGSSTLTL